MRTSEQVSAMVCPVCRVPLAMSDRQGIEIDYCPQCRGVWLDRGELDKVIERSMRDAPPAAPLPPRAPTPPPRPHPQAEYVPPPPRGYDDDRPGYDQRGGKPYRKQKHWLSEFFD